jgi:hypothetical protein
MIKHYRTCEELIPVQNKERLSKLSKEQLIAYIDMCAKNWLAMDGVWFQSVEKKDGMDTAMWHDVEIWKKFTVFEAQRIKEFLRLPEHPGLDGLAKALQYRLYANLNKDEIVREGNVLIYRSIDCRVQRARERKGMEFHPCKPVGLVEYAGFAKAIDDRIQCTFVSCYPEITDESCCCAWKFWIE